MIDQTNTVVRCIQLVPYLLDIGEVQFGKHYITRLASGLVSFHSGAQQEEQVEMVLTYRVRRISQVHSYPSKNSIPNRTGVLV